MNLHDSQPDNFARAAAILDSDIVLTNWPRTRFARGTYDGTNFTHTTPAGERHCLAWWEGYVSQGGAAWGNITAARASTCDQSAICQPDSHNR